MSYGPVYSRKDLTYWSNSKQCGFHHSVSFSKETIKQGSKFIEKKISTADCQNSGSDVNSFNLDNFWVQFPSPTSTTLLQPSSPVLFSSAVMCARWSRDSLVNKPPTSFRDYGPAIRQRVIEMPQGLLGVFQSVRSCEIINGR
jgi:hypothetical protein